MSAQENARLARSYFQSPSADFFAEDAQMHDLSQPRPLRGRESIRAFLSTFLGEAFPEGGYELRGLLADERLTMAEWVFRGTNTGPLMGSPPTGRTVEFPGVTVHEIRDGKFVRARVYYDTGTLAEQLGLTGERVPASERERWAEWWKAQVADDAG